MANHITAPEITETMKRLLLAVPKYAFVPQETTFFSIEAIGGIIGRLENPITELLRFFMNPDGGHDLGTLFLRAFFTCLDGCSNLAIDGAESVSRGPTRNGNYVDLLFQHRNWVLVIENKIDSQINNPLDDYEEFAKNHTYSNAFLTILSPNEKADTDHPNWKAVSYQQFCNSLKAELAKTIFDRAVAKWQIFAREFIVFLEHKTCRISMTLQPDQTNFVEENLQDVEKLRRLSACYTAELVEELSTCLNKELQASARFSFREGFDDSGNPWALLCDIPGPPKLRFVFQTPAHPQSDGKFLVSVYVPDTHIQRAEELLKGIGPHEKPERERRGAFVGERCFTKRGKAVEALGALAKSLWPLVKNDVAA